MATRAVAFTATFYAYDSATGGPKTGDSANITPRLSKDGTSAALTTTTVTEVDATNFPGSYKVSISSTEADCNALEVGGKSSTSGVYIVPTCYQMERLPDAAPDAAGGVRDVARIAGTSQTARDVGASVLVGDKTGFSLSSAYDPAKTAAQAGDAMALTSGERTTLAASIWNALTSGFSTAGSIGKRIVDYLTGDSFARLGAPAGASHAADVAAVKALLEHGSYGLSALKDSIVNITGNTLSTAAAPKLLERPDSGSKTYRTLLYLFDEAGNYADADSTPTVTAENDQGTDRSANLSAVTRDAAGRYRADYTVAAGHALEAITVKWAWTRAAKAQGLPVSTTVVETTAETFTSTDRTKLDTIHSRMPGSTVASAANVAALENLSAAGAQSAAAAALAAYDPATRAEATSDKDAILTRLGTPAGASVSADIATAVAAIAAQHNVSPAEVLAQAAAALASYDPPTRAEATADKAAILAVVDPIKVVTDKLATAIELDGSVWRFTTNALEQAPAGGGGGGGAVDLTSGAVAAVVAGINAAEVEAGVTRLQAERAVAAVLAGVYVAGTTSTFAAIGNPGTVRISSATPTTGGRTSIVLTL